MASPNRFAEIESANSSPDAASGGGNRFAAIENPAGATEGDNIKYGPGFGSQLAGFLRMASNALSLGGRDRLAGMLPGNDYKTEEARTNQFKKDSPLISLAGEVAGGIPTAAMGGTALGATLPVLNKATIPMIAAKNAIVSGAMPAVEDVVRGRLPDPVKAGTSAAIGGGMSTALAMGAKMNPFSPSFKVRSDSADLIGDKPAMRNLSATGDRVGIPLTVPELAGEVAPGRAARLESTYNLNSRMKEGEIAARNFDQSRAPMIQRAVGSVKALIGNGPANGLPAQEAAQAAIKRQGDLVKNSADPYYKSAEPVIVSDVPKLPAITAARKEAFKTPIIKDTLKGVDKNSVQALDEAQHRLEAGIQRAEKDPRLQGLLIDSKKKLLGAMDEASPDYATARGIQTEGRGSVANLEAGPLGTMTKTTNPTTQANAVLKVDSPAEIAQSRQAIERLRTVNPGTPDNAIPQGLLASRVDEAAANPNTFGRKLMPTDESGSVISDIVGADKFGQVKDVLLASRARDAAGRPGGGENSDGPISGLWNQIQSIRSGKIVNMLNDPATIEKLGTVGPLQGLLNATGDSIANEISAPLIVDVKKRPIRTKGDDDLEKEKIRRAALR